MEKIKKSTDKQLVCFHTNEFFKNLIKELARINLN